jgi:hypothetical protein
MDHPHALTIATLFPLYAPPHEATCSNQCSWDLQPLLLPPSTPLPKPTVWQEDENNDDEVESYQNSSGGGNGDVYKQNIIIQHELPFGIT